MMKPTEKGDETETMSLRSLKKRLGSVCVDRVPSPTSNKFNIGRLRRMVHDLEKMDAAWRGALTSQPSKAEQILYMLILGHVSSDIFLFHREKSTGLRALPEEEDVGFIVKGLRNRAGAFGIAVNGSDLDISGDEEEGDISVIDDASDELLRGRDLVDTLIDLVKDMRDTISIPANSNTGKAPSKIEIGGEETRVQTLEKILRGLARRRRERAYAPPVDEELICYRDIRKWVTSIVTFVNAKHSWLTAWKDCERPRLLRVMGEAECRNRFPVERVHACMGEWDNFIIEHGYTSKVEFLAPWGNQIALVFDELPEFLLLLSAWRRRFSDIAERILKGELMDVFGSIDNGGKVEVVGGKRARVRPEREVGKKKKKRKHYLVDIASAYLSMDMKSCLSSREVRLYTRILEHVRSSIWLFEKRATSGERQVYWEYGWKEKEQSKGKKDRDLSRYTLPVPEMTPWRGTREENLQEIMRLVEKIESTFLCLPPTVKEVILYKKLEKHMKKDFVEPRCSQKLAEEDAYRIARYLMKDTCDMEIMIARHLMKELGDTLRTIFRRVPQDTQAAEWLMDHREDAASMLKELIADSPQGPEYFDHLMLGLYEAGSLTSQLPENLSHANDLVEALMYTKKQYQVPILDCWVALSRAEAFGFVLDGCDI